jgi:hypothetical protein
MHLTNPHRLLSLAKHDQDGSSNGTQSQLPKSGPSGLCSRSRWAFWDLEYGLEQGFQGSTRV